MIPEVRQRYSGVQRGSCHCSGNPRYSSRAQPLESTDSKKASSGHSVDVLICALRTAIPKKCCRNPKAKFKRSYQMGERTEKLLFARLFCAECDRIFRTETEVNFAGLFSKTDSTSRAGIMPEVSVSLTVSFSFENKITTKLITESEAELAFLPKFTWGEPLIDGILGPVKDMLATGESRRMAAARDVTIFLDCFGVSIVIFLFRCFQETRTGAGGQSK